MRLAPRIAGVIKIIVALFVIADVLLLVPQTRHLMLYWACYELRCPLSAVVRTPETQRVRAAAGVRLESAIRLQREDGNYRLWQTPKGPIWMPVGSDHLVRFLMAEQETQVYETDRARVNPGDVVLDCGAHVGIYTREALRAGARLVVAVEPGPENLECLRRNVAEELKEGRVIICPKGVWDREAQLALRRDPGNSGADRVVTAGNEGDLRVPLTTIDNLVEELRLERVDFIKMDIEGAERRALRGAQKTLARYRPRLAIASYHLPGDYEAIPSAVLAGWSGYRSACRSCAVVDKALVPEVLFFH